MIWEFNIGDKVYDKTRNQNGVVTLRKYVEESHIKYYAYHVVYWTDGHPQSEWQASDHLELDHRAIID